MHTLSAALGWMQAGQKLKAVQFKSCISNGSKLQPLSVNRVMQIFANIPLKLKKLKVLSCWIIKNVVHRKCITTISQILVAQMNTICLSTKLCTFLDSSQPPTSRYLDLHIQFVTRKWFAFKEKSFCKSLHGPRQFHFGV